MEWKSKLGKGNRWRGLLLFAFLLLPAQIFAQSTSSDAGNAQTGLYLGLVGAVLAVLFALYKTRVVLRESEGNDRMKEIASYIREGADAFLNQQYKWIGIFIVFVFISLFFVYSKQEISWAYPLAFITGGLISAATGYFGMKIATRSNARTAWAANDSLNKGLNVAFSAGSVMGLTVVGLGLLFIVVWYIILNGLTNGNVAQATEILFSFGMGASSVALFARLGGGIYTKAADVGADLVGKVEAGIPEDDPRNPATIADNVGDNVGDVAGMGADLFESYVGSIIATMALAVVAFPGSLSSALAPIAVAGLGIICSIIGTMLVKTREDATQESLLWSLRKAIYGAAILMVIGAFAVLVTLMNMHWGIFAAMVTGLLAGNIIGYFTEYYTSDNYKPTKEVSQSAETGPATVIISGLALGMKSTTVPVITIVVGTILAFFLAGLGAPVGADMAAKSAVGLFGIGMAAVGMLSTLGITLATDAYGPVADNAGGIAEMAGLDPSVRTKTDALDSLGNTTAATGKGFAIGSAALTALTLLAAFSGVIARWAEEENRNMEEFFSTDLTNPYVLAGLFIGGMVPFLFSAMTMKAVGRAAMSMVTEVRRQFKEISGIMEGKTKPDYQNCVKISTDGALRQMVLPTLLALLTPIFVGGLLGPGAMMAMLGGTLVAGFALAIMMANAGGAWDNAKKYIEAGHFGGKGSEAHKAGVVGDTVGDPFKDTSGPSINILIKLMSIVSVVFGPAIFSLNDWVMSLLK